MTYDQSLDFLYSCHSSVYKDLTRIHYVLECLGNPQEAFPSVLIAGTNGKGSTAKMLSSILQRAGYHVGCFTSPHLLDFAERISVDDRPISHEEIVKLAEELKQGPLEAIEPNRKRLGIEGNVCFFELVTAMAFVYFARQDVDIAVLEVGMGGRLDPTNTINPLVSVITNVGLDHQKFLGSTLEEIAGEKAGIIHEQGDVVIGCQQTEVLEVIEMVCRKQHAMLYRTGIETSEDNEMMDGESQIAARTLPQKVTSTGSFFLYQGLRVRYDDLYLRLAGKHQLANAAVALCTLELLGHKGFSSNEAHIRNGLANVSHPGRLEIIHTNPIFVVDIAHNAMGARTIAHALTSLFDYDKLIMIIGVLHDKDVQGILRPLLEVAHSLIFTSPHSSDRAETAAATARIAEELVSTPLQPTSDNTDPCLRYDHWIICESVEAAIHKGHEFAGKRDVICVTGSNYTVSEAETIYNQQFC